MRSSELVSQQSTLFVCLCDTEVVLSVFRVVLQQNERFSQIDEKYKSLHGKTSSLFDMEEEVLKVSAKVKQMIPVQKMCALLVVFTLHNICECNLIRFIF